MDSGEMKKFATTTVSSNNSTVVPDAVRTSEEIVPGDTLDWYLADESWVIVPKDSDADE